MPPKQRVVVQSSSRRIQDKRGYLSTAYHELTSSENASVVRSVVAFGAVNASFYINYAERRFSLCSQTYSPIPPARTANLHDREALELVLYTLK
ncbi:hypothetical protein CPC735_041880 [Coccidioides posadasii C735 delta SOWgp]|uniref:Uncharacterized protein n=1 Tax=Coccidioides posadasii (strain C735) TaxID=222929 RepID=C5PAW0_COCP7|nr:hypothetical protein CPC735_041880 [Coccidioides posadasii C735 delta SOWgp]EER25744.1 hypothetical protein CPC735_041880 [Coccidioides posadasii C735 delta SOWgp]|eukprot:XP_003067889.1 hypothetical protein CPC735_041880 [Coccidioides posadasii C735 delta SOWgp]